MANFIKILILAIGSSIAIKCNSYFLKQNINVFLSMFISSVLAVTLIKISETLFLDFFVRFSIFRPILDPRAKFEGIWILSLLNFEDRPYSYATIEYNTTSKDFMYYGSGFNSLGEIKSQWNSVELSIDIDKYEIRFFAEAQFSDSDGEFFKNWGRLTFEKESFGRKFTRGKGFFVDFGTNFNKGHFLMERLSPRQIEELIGKKTIHSHSDMTDLIKKYNSINNGCNPID